MAYQLATYDSLLKAMANMPGDKDCEARFWLDHYAYAHRDFDVKNNAYMWDPESPPSTVWPIVRQTAHVSCLLAAKGVPPSRSIVHSQLVDTLTQVRWNLARMRTSNMLIGLALWQVIIVRATATSDKYDRVSSRRLVAPAFFTANTPVPRFSMPNITDAYFQKSQDKVSASQNSINQAVNELNTRQPILRS